MAGWIARLARGAAAGVLGTLAMDVLWWRRYRRGGGEDGFLDWEFATGVDSFEVASAPGRVGQRVAGLFGVDLPDEAAGATTNAVHWLTGVGYGIAHEPVHDGDRPALRGLGTGVGAFANSYATLGALGVYEPIWQYDAATLRDDLTAHLLFGTTTALFSRGGRAGASVGRSQPQQPEQRQRHADHEQAQRGLGPRQP